MKKLFSILSCLLFFAIGSLRSQTITTQAIHALRLRQIEDALDEKIHLPEGKIPDVKVPGKKNDEQESPLAQGEEKISTTSPESEVHAAINPTDTTNIVIGPIHLVNAINGMTLPIYYTNNFGQSWKKSTFQPLPYEKGASIEGGGDPVFAYDADGKLYMSWIDTYQNSLTSDTIHQSIYWAYSTNGGQSWQQPVHGYIGLGWYMIQNNQLSKTVGLDDKQWLAVDRSNSPYHNSLYVAWTHLGLDGTYGVMVRRKKPGVDSMETAVQVSSNTMVLVQYTSLGVDAHGGFHVTYMGSLDGINYGIYHSYSSDGGKTFSQEVNISDVDIPGRSQDATSDLIFGIRPQGNYPCAHLSIDTAVTGNLYEVWSALGTDADQQQGTDIYFSRSTDNGTSWSNASIVNNDRDTENGNYFDHFFPSICVNGNGKISVTWYDRREDPNNEIGRYYIAQSTDQGQTWTNGPVATTPMNFKNVMKVNQSFGIGEYTQVLTTPTGYTIPVWTDGRTPDGNLRIYAAFLSGSQAGVERLSSISDGLQLSDNYPNPFGTNTKFSFTLNSAAHARLYVSNIAGQRIANIYDGMAETGEHDFTFDGSILPNGVYYLNLESDLGVARSAITILH